MNMVEPVATQAAPRGGWVDAHHHLWDLDSNPHYPWLADPQARSHFGDYRAIQVNYPVGRYLNDFHGTGLTKSVHCEAGWGGVDAVRETQWLQQIGDAHGFPHGLIVPCRLEQADNAQQLDRHLQFNRVRGARQLLFKPSDVGSGNFTAGALLQHPAWLHGFTELARRGLTFDMQAVAPMMPAVQQLAQRFSDVTIIITHLGLPLDRSAQGLRQWQLGLEEVAVCPNVMIKLSGLPMSDWHWTAKSIAPLIDVTLNAFGPQRIMVGSNFPVDSLHAQGPGLIDAYRVCIARLSPDEQHGILCANAERIYRI